MIRPAKPSDASAIAEIYNYYVLNSIATFEEEMVDEDEMKKRILSVTSKLPWMVFERGEEVIGYAYAGQWNSRSAYNQTAEITIYLKNGETRGGLGTLLYSELISRLKSMSYHVIIGGISLPNESSIRLHEKFGLEKVAHFKEVGFKFEKWIDVGYWELVIKN